MLALQRFLSAQHLCLGHSLLIFAACDIAVVPALSVGDVGAPEAIVGNGPAQLGVEIDGVESFSCSVAPSTAVGGATCPALDSVLAGQLGIFLHGRAPYSAGQVYLQSRQLVLGICEAQYAAVGRCRSLDTDIIVGEHNRIVARPGRLGGFVVAGAPPFHAAILLSGGSMERAGGGHDHNISKVAIPSHAAHLGHREAFDGRVLIAIAWSVIASSDCLGAHLRHPERRCSAGECLSQAMGGTGSVDVGRCSDKRIHTRSQVFLLGIKNGNRKH